VTLAGVYPPTDRGGPALTTARKVAPPPARPRQRGARRREGSRRRWVPGLRGRRDRPRPAGPGAARRAVLWPAGAGVSSGSGVPRDLLLKTDLDRTPRVRRAAGQANHAGRALGSGCVSPRRHHRLGVGSSARSCLGHLLERDPRRCQGPAQESTPAERSRPSVSTSTSGGRRRSRPRTRPSRSWST
jgi:hypothetical protein